MNLIDINGNIDTSLSRGLRKRMAREASARIDREAERLNRMPSDAEAHWSGKRWMIERARQVRGLIGEQHVATVQLSKRERMILSLDPEPVGRLYFVDAMLLDRKHRTVNSAPAPVALTTHFVERYFQRIGRPFAFAELTLVVRAAATVIAHDNGLRPELTLRMADGLVYWERGMMTPDGLPVPQSTEPDMARSAMIAKTFIHAQDMSGKRRAEWERAATGQRVAEMAPEGLLP
jgi:hypothetical protein